MSKLSIDELGRVQLPPEVREQLGLTKNDIPQILHHSQQPPWN